ncbi:MAG: transcriptional regulator, Rrf2 [Rhodopirellula sp.]|nr:transcriptional regulator, Rrf2 [Rhodopirellula sp.]OUX51165.1 MAG: transcriptional regulator, Rrf2 [Rhodopirellula sp. TMED283]
MVISARVHYACVAMLELAIQNDEGSPVAIREITDRHGIPGPFLVQILRSLRALGWVQSIRGSQGGYRLSVDPATITLLDIAEAIGSQEAGCRTEATCTPMAVMLQTQWDDAAEASRRVLGQATLSGLVERAQHGDASMFYI